MAEEMTPKQIFEERIAGQIKADPEKAKSLNAIYQFDISGPNGGTWTVSLKGDNPGVTEGPAQSPGCTITMADKDFVDLVAGKLQGQTAFMSGKLKIKGDMSLAMKLQQVIGGK